MHSCYLVRYTVAMVEMDSTWTSRSVNVHFLYNLRHLAIRLLLLSAAGQHDPKKS